MMTPEEQLLDYRRAVAGIYGRARASRPDPAARCQQFRQERDALFGTHTQSALSADQQARFRGLSYYPYDAAFRYVLPVQPEPEAEIREVELQEDGLVRMRRFGKTHFTVAGQTVALSLYWIMGYGGGIFLPFADLTSGHETYGGGRYLLDTIKYADLGHEDQGLVIDFNYAYNPSCVYNPRWSCPLAPRENRLPVAIPVGEKVFEG